MKDLYLLLLSIACFLDTGNGQEFTYGQTLTYRAGVSESDIEHGIFEDELNWFEARQRCLDMGYDDLDDGASDYVRYTGVAQRLQEDGLTNIDKLWTFFHRVTPQSLRWYRTGCVVTDNVDNSLKNTTGDQQCIIVSYNTDYTRQQEARDCDQAHSFMCTKYIGNASFEKFTSFAYSSYPTTCTLQTSSAKTLDACELDCYNRFYCVSYIHNIWTAVCTLLRLDNDKVWADLVISSTYLYQVLGIRSGLVFTVNPYIGPTLPVFPIFPCSAPELTSISSIDASVSSIAVSSLTTFTETLLSVPTLLPSQNMSSVTPFVTMVDLTSIQSSTTQVTPALSLLLTSFLTQPQTSYTYALTELISLDTSITQMTVSPTSVTTLELTQHHSSVLVEAVHSSYLDTSFTPLIATPSVAFLSSSTTPSQTVPTVNFSLLPSAVTLPSIETAPLSQSLSSSMTHIPIVTLTTLGASFSAPLQSMMTQPLSEHLSPFMTFLPTVYLATPPIYFNTQTKVLQSSMTTATVSQFLYSPTISLTTDDSTSLHSQISLITVTPSTITTSTLPVYLSSTMPHITTIESTCLDSLITQTATPSSTMISLLASHLYLSTIPISTFDSTTTDSSFAQTTGTLSSITTLHLSHHLFSPTISNIAIDSTFLNDPYTQTTNTPSSTTITSLNSHASLSTTDIAMVYTASYITRLPIVHHISSSTTSITTVDSTNLATSCTPNIATPSSITPLYIRATPVYSHLYSSSTPTSSVDTSTSDAFLLTPTIETVSRFTTSTMSHYLAYFTKLIFSDEPASANLSPTLATFSIPTATQTHHLSLLTTTLTTSVITNVSTNYVSSLTPATEVPSPITTSPVVHHLSSSTTNALTNNLTALDTSLTLPTSISSIATTPGYNYISPSSMPKIVFDLSSSDSLLAPTFETESSIPTSPLSQYLFYSTTLIVADGSTSAEASPIAATSSGMTSTPSYYLHELMTSGTTADSTHLMASLTPTTVIPLSVMTSSVSHQISSSTTHVITFNSTTLESPLTLPTSTPYVATSSVYTHLSSYSSPMNAVDSSIADSLLILFLETAVLSPTLPLSHTLFSPSPLIVADESTSAEAPPTHPTSSITTSTESLYISSIIASTTTTDSTNFDFSLTPTTTIASSETTLPLSHQIFSSTTNTLTLNSTALESPLTLTTTHFSVTTTPAYLHPSSSSTSIPKVVSTNTYYVLPQTIETASSNITSHLSHHISPSATSKYIVDSTSADSLLKQTFATSSLLTLSSVSQHLSSSIATVYPTNANSLLALNTPSAITTSILSHHVTLSSTLPPTTSHASLPSLATVLVSISPSPTTFSASEVSTSPVSTNFVSSLTPATAFPSPITTIATVDPTNANSLLTLNTPSMITTSPLSHHVTLSTTLLTTTTHALTPSLATAIVSTSPSTSTSLASAIPTTQSTINVTGFIGWSRPTEYRLLMQPVTWFEADQLCRLLGYGAFDKLTSPTRCPTWHAASILQENLVYQNVSIWSKVFRNNDVNSDWYSVRNDHSQCFVRGLNIASDEGQCSYMHFSQDRELPELRSTNCSNKLPAFMCSNYLQEPIPFTSYSGYDVKNLPPNTIFVWSSVSSEVACIASCRLICKCVGVSYINNASSNCVGLKLTAASENIEYTLTVSTQDVTHFVKSGTKGQFYQENGTRISVSVEETLPICPKPQSSSVEPDLNNTTFQPQTDVNTTSSQPQSDVSNNTTLKPQQTGVCQCQAQPGLCPKQNTYVEPTLEGLEREMKEVLTTLEKELTVNRSTTSRHRRARESAKDERQSSTTIGTIAVLVISAAASVVIVPDIVFMTNGIMNIIRSRYNTPSLTTESRC